MFNQIYKMCITTTCLPQGIEGIKGNKGMRGLHGLDVNPASNTFP
jgi:hypothetical protein